MGIPLEDTALTEFTRLYGFGAGSLRYFNVAGAASRIQSDLGWRARRDLRAMVADAWQVTQVRSIKCGS